MASAAQTLPMSIEEYLSTSFRPDVDYVDGYLEERNVGEADHGTMLFLLASYFYSRRKMWNVRMYLDTRMRTGPSRFRVPDVCISANTDGREQIIRTAPMLCIEVLSPEDTLRKMVARVQEYLQMGVANVWIFDPQRRSVAVCRPDGSYSQQSSGRLALAGTAVSVEIEEGFAALDEET